MLFKLLCLEAVPWTPARPLQPGVATNGKVSSFRVPRGSLKAEGLGFFGFRIWGSRQLSGIQGAVYRGSGFTQPCFRASARRILSVSESVRV